MGTTLELDGVEKAYAGFRLGPIDLAVDEEVLAVLGPSGCGKTTLLSTIAGTVTADAGSIRLAGTDVTGRPPEDRGAALVFQDGALFPHMTARENVAYAAADPARVDDLAGTLEIEGVLEQRADTLSGGERQRVALARALAAEPAALLLDEPLANLDAPIRRRLRDDLRDLFAGLDVPVVYVTHDQTEASSVGDRVAVMADGRVRQVGTPTAVFDRPATPFVARFTGGANVFRATVAPDGGLEWGSYRLEVDTPAEAPEWSVDADEAVWFCVRPEHVEVVGDPSGEPVADTSPTSGAPTQNAAPGENVVEGRLAGRVFEGGTYRLTLRPAGVDATVEVAVLPPTFERFGLRTADRVAVSFPPQAIHVVEGSADGRD